VSERYEALISVLNPYPAVNAKAKCWRDILAVVASKRHFLIRDYRSLILLPSGSHL